MHLFTKTKYHSDWAEAQTEQKEKNAQRLWQLYLRLILYVDCFIPLPLHIHSNGKWPVFIEHFTSP